MKKLLIGMAALACFAVPGMAQQKAQKAPPARPDETKMVQQRTNEMVKTYGLTKAQATKLLALNKKYPRVAMRPGAPGAGGVPPKGQPPRDGKQSPKDGKQSPKGDMQPPKDGKRPPEPPKDGRGQAGKGGPEAEQKAYNAQLAKIMTAAQYKKYQADEKKNRPQPPRKK